MRALVCNSVFEPTRLNRPSCVTRSSLACSGGDMSPISSRKIVPPFGHFEPADPLRHRAGERALFVPEQLALQQRLGNGRAVHLHHRPVRARAPGMNDVRQRLPCPRRFRR